MLSCFTPVILWGSVAVLVYSYGVYPVLLLSLAVLQSAWREVHFLVFRKGRRLSDRPPPADFDLPFVSFVLAARNEASMILLKIENFQALDYPKEKMELLVGSDASDDATVSLARGAGDMRIRVFDYKDRTGKIGVLKRLVKEARGSLLVFSDANTFLRPPALRNLVRHFSDPSVGAVCGELRLEAPDGTLQSEGLYWRYETALKTLENRFGAVLGANGGNYVLRKELFPEIPADTIIEDFVIPLLIRKQGYRCPFEPEGLALERNPVDPQAEFKRRVRIGAGDLQSVPLVAPLLSPRFGMVALALFSHKFLRWLAPIAMITAFVSNATLWDRPGYSLLLIAQVGFYGLALVGWMRHRPGRRAGAQALPFLFTSLNAALLIGYIQYLRGQHRVAWDRTAREAVS